VEDDDDTQLALVQFFESMGLAADGATTNAQALSLARAQRPDLITTDHNHPGAKGIELIRAVRAAPLLQDVPIILISGNVTKAEEAAAWRAGASEVLPKPFRPEEIVNAVNELLGH